MIRTLALGPSDRVLVLAPHPDDESAATGGILQHALAAGAGLLVLFFTNGDNNPWAQRATELRWRIGPADRARFAALRREEVRAAVARLGVPDGACRFLGYPDQSTTDLLLHGNDVALGKLVAEIRQWRPTVAVGPSLLDLHPDHSALGVMLALALAALAPEVSVRHHARFLVHNPLLRARHEATAVLPLTAEQRRRKLDAILCHRSQLRLRGSWLPSFAEAEERYFIAESPFGIARHPVRGARLEAESAVFEIESASHLRAFGGRTLCLVGGSPAAAGIRLAAPLPASPGAAPLVDLRTGGPAGEARFAGRGGRGELRVPLALVASQPRLYAKIERAHGFFDEAGWRELSLDAPPL
ncbi:MAG TPA: PIG-L family deacetylase [Thermoanaerobaculaceae bacterium]|nr:PIG-L family deacetylase [Thermoanaerobaculaceae bacterium]